MSSQLIDVSGGRLYVEVAGLGQPILLLHGWPLDHRMFQPQIKALAKRFRVIAPDRRGFGKSDANPDLRREVDDIDAVLDALGEDTTHLLGMSQGGRIALRYATTRPERVRSLLLQGAVIDGYDVAGSEDDGVPVAQYAELVANGRLDKVVDQWLQHPMMHLDEQHQSAQQLLREIMEEYRGLDLLNFDAASYAPANDVFTALSELPVPTLVLTGAEETPTRRAHAAALKSRIPDCHEVVFHSSGHLSNLTEPDRYNAAIIEFCEGLSAKHLALAGGAVD